MRSLAGLTLLVLTACTPPRVPSTPTAPTPVPEPAIPAILAAFDRYDIVAMSAGHGLKDVDDFILALVRAPGFPDKVNDIAVECGNSLYQPVLDRYIAGVEVPFAEVRKVWRNTTQEMCGYSSFFEQLFPLVRAINQKLPAPRRLRVLAGDPPIDWDAVKTRDDAWKFLARDPAIAAVMAKEVLARHRKALMLFGTFHLLHGTSDDRAPTPSQPIAPPSAVSLYEKEYPHRTFVVSDLGIYDTSPFASWVNPSLVRIAGTRLGASSLKQVLPAPISTRDCKVTIDFPANLRKPVEALVDAFLYLGPQQLRLNEPTPADIALDTDYLTELSRRASLIGPPGAPAQSPAEIRDEILQEAQQPIREAPRPPEIGELERACREMQQRGPHPL